MKDSDMLLRVYIGQEVNYTRGILYKFKDKSIYNEEENKAINSLIEKSLITEKKPYSIRAIITLVTTKLGKEEAKKQISNIINQSDSLVCQLNQIPKKALGFLVINYEDRLFKENREEFTIGWEDFVLNRSKMFDYGLKLCKILEEHKLAVLTHDYVSTNGGRIDPQRFVIADEAVEFITKNLDPRPFEYGETKQAILLSTISEIEEDILSIKDEERRRGNYWNLLRSLPFDESAIKKVINEFHQENITTEYFEINNEHFLFAILDKSRFRIRLDKMVDEFITKIIEGKKAEIETLTKPSELLRTHSELFATIGNFEMRFREGLIKEMRLAYKESKDSWYEQLKQIKSFESESHFSTLFDKLESRKADDVRNRLWPENELIYYADIVDYKEIIFNNWTIFEAKLKKADLSKEKFDHGMNELNKIRRKVMHLREIRPHEAKTVRLFIIPELEKVFR